MAHNMESIAVYPVDIILPQIGPEQKILVNDEHWVGASSLRMQTFKEKGVDCVVCGCKGAYFSAERQIWRNKLKERPFVGSYHFNLYGITPTGTLRLMTHDHIIPLSNYGANTLENSTTMCEKCNSKKGSKIPSADFVRKYGGAITLAHSKKSNKKVPHGQTARP